ncbi:MAG TPA: extracellular solute-binding protein [Jatrophihabitantaceae bacterium]|nr:extracellular solute-binding protein [Jatrophihabitantaceae bacterium]
MATAAAIGVTACSSSAGGDTGGGGGGKVKIVAYSVPKPAYDALETAFKATPEGKGVSFSSSYGASGAQSKSVASGQPADFVNFSTGSDLTKLVPQFVAQDWNAGATKGIVSTSVVVLVVRKGNPKHITGWDDLIKPGIKIVTPDPASSGSAKWNALAAYEHTIANGGTEAQAKEFLTKFFKNVVAKPSSGAQATSTFTSGTGDVLVSYESEAIQARVKGANVDYVVPQDSFLIETPAAVTAKASKAAKDFLAFALSAQGQQIFASHGFRPAVSGVTTTDVKGANDPSNPYPTVAKLTTIGELGGWSAVNKKFFDPDNGIVIKIENSTG